MRTRKRPRLGFEAGVSAHEDKTPYHAPLRGGRTNSRNLQRVNATTCGNYLAEGHTNARCPGH